MLVSGRLYLRYDAGYKVSKYLANQPKLMVVDYHVGYSSLEFHNENPYVQVESSMDLKKIDKPYYLILNQDKWDALKSSSDTGVVVDTFPWIRQEKYIPKLFNLKKREQDTEELVLVLESQEKTKLK